MIRLFAEGLGAIRSRAVIARALEAGVQPQRIVYAGIAKTDDEIRMALGTGILQFNVESAQELPIGELASAMGLAAPVALRVNPDVDAGTHEKISTGRKHDKFGIPYEDAPELYRVAAGMKGVIGRLACICTSAHKSVISIRSRRPTAGVWELFTSLRARASRCTGLTSAAASACVTSTSRAWKPRPWPILSAGSPPGSTASSCSSLRARSSPRRYRSGCGNLS